MIIWNFKMNVKVALRILKEKKEMLMIAKNTFWN
jgi:hypothetical protein